MYQYHTNCINSTAHLIGQMIARADQISYGTFSMEVSIAELRALFPFYDWDEEGGLEMQNDYHIAHFRSVYAGWPCLYLVHSAIEYVFIDRDTQVESLISVELTPEELGTVLAALRYYQTRYLAAAYMEPDDTDDIASDGGTLNPLTIDEVDDLCEKINGG